MFYFVLSVLVLVLVVLMVVGLVLVEIVIFVFVMVLLFISGDIEVSNNFSIVCYCVDYQVWFDVGNVQIEIYEVLFKIKVFVEQFSQVWLSYSEKMEMLEVFGVYIIIVDGQCCDVLVDCIYM